MDVVYDDYNALAILSKNQIGWNDTTHRLI